MLDRNTLKEHIANGISTIVCPAIKECILRSYPVESDIGNATAEKFANNFDELVADQFAEIIASAIDYYIKNAELYGTIITTGTPFTQTAVLTPTPVPISNGKIPNTIGIK